MLTDLIADEHDYVWARLPFLVPMAVATARRRREPSVHELARRITELCPLLLDHLDREEAVLARVSEDRTTVWDGMRSEHVAVTALLADIRAIASTVDRADADRTERALYDELARLDMHVQRQIDLEERLMATPRSVRTAP